MKTRTKKVWSRFRATILVIGLVLASIVGVSAPAFADSTLCSGNAYSTCTNAGYTDHGYSNHPSTMYWTMYAGHNCTNYVAYAEQQAGAAATMSTNLHDAGDWATNAVSNGATVDNTPTVGSVAQWNDNADGGYATASGHVAYVEAVNSSNGAITISEDNYNVGPFTWKMISAGSSIWPSNFIHFPGVTVSTTGTGRGIPASSRAVVTPDGNPHVYPVSPAGTVKEVTWTGSAWVTHTAASTTATGTVASSSILLNSTNPHVYSLTSSGEVHETQWNGSNWSTGQVGFTASGAIAISAVATPDGKPHVYSATSSGALYESQWTGTQWSTGQIYGAFGSGVVSDSAVVDSNGYPHIYTVKSTGEVYESQWNGSNWSTGQIYNFGNIGVVSVSAVVAANSAPHVYTASSSGAVYESTWTGSSWATGLAGFAASGLVSVSAVITPDGRPHVYTVTYGGDVYETQWTGVSWSTSSSPLGYTSSGASSISAVVMPNGYPHAYTITGAAVYESQWTGAAWSTGSVGTL